MSFSFALSTNVDDGGIQANNYQNLNTFQEQEDACYGLTKSNNETSYPLSTGATCFDEGFKAAICALTSTSAPAPTMMPRTMPTSTMPTSTPTSTPSMMPFSGTTRACRVSVIW
eukprot:CAMPEP_0197840290 /NCGR_PEP_ID=MMETSP1437-20131217/45525_1 /TAXON_ID=49252 ORGANISM="Eucampia antarctica, Strain CCMP1452" /NCGR_SAMPLE_ID=MMETSP1437 /ASSEMBLY_ACC=CAM_ASM_001096 /LENGTH=113 /DNA_ID=CAMNT_0043449883 /DNA_START=1104 /DNA_END=1442 /DNA_ORIENTATION=-